MPVEKPPEAEPILRTSTQGVDSQFFHHIEESERLASLTLFGGPHSKFELVELPFLHERIRNRPP